MPFPFVFPLTFDAEGTPTGLTVTSRLALSTKPNEAPTWIDVSAYVRRILCRRGRQHELDRIEAGTDRMLLDNRTRLFEPEYAGALEDFLPERRVNHRISWLGVDYDIFTGFIEETPLLWPARGKDAVTQVNSYDGFAVLARAEVRASLPQEKTGMRVDRLLTGANWTTGNAWVLNSTVNSKLNSTTRLGPVGDRLISDGQSTMQALDLTEQETKALDHLRLVEDTEGGIAFVNGAGQLVFQSRHLRLQPPYTVSQATFGDGGGSEIPIADLEGAYTVHEVRNDVRVKVTGGDIYESSDSTSKSNYHTSSYSREVSLAGDAAHEAQSASRWLLNRYKDPHIRFRRVKVKLASVPQALWPTLFGLEISDRVTVIIRPDSGGAALSQDCHIENVEYDIQPALAELTISFAVTPANANSYWKLNRDALATGTRLAY